MNGRLLIFFQTCFRSIFEGKTDYIIYFFHVYDICTHDAIHYVIILHLPRCTTYLVIIFKKFALFNFFFFKFIYTNIQNIITFTYLKY